MVDVVHKKCGGEGCSTRPSYGVAGSTKAEFCPKHARAGMVNVRDKKCGQRNCSKNPSYGVAGSTKAEFCAKHARVGMMSVRRKECGDEGCSRDAASVVRCGRKQKGGVLFQACQGGNGEGEEEEVQERSTSALDKKPDVAEAKFSRQHAIEHSTAMASDATKVNTAEGCIGRSATEGGGESVANSREVKRKRAVVPGSVANDSVGTCRRVCTGARQSVRTPLFSGNPPLLSRYPPSTTAGLFSGVRAGAAMKIELTVPTGESDGDGLRECREQVALSRNESRNRGSNGVINSGIASTGRLCGSPAVVPGHGRMPTLS
ncbi:unnamed protein product [Sphacelaria rigidula]